MADLIKRLQKEGVEFDFFTAISLLEKKLESDGVADPLDSGRLRFIADPSLCFPVSDISSIKDIEGTIQFMLSFMGLAGVSSPLPIYFSEEICRDPENSAALYDLLSIFNHRIYRLFYGAWKKYLKIRQFNASVYDPLTPIVASIAGLDPDNLSPDNLRTLACCAQMALPAKSSTGLAALISGYFNGIEVRIREFLPARLPILNVEKLGSSCLGKNSVLGDSLIDISGKFRVIIGPLNQHDYQKFLPGSRRILSMKKLINSFLCDPLQYDIEILLQSKDLVPCSLGADTARLGEVLSLGKWQGEAGVCSVIIT